MNQELPSFVHGASEVPLCYLTMGDVLDAAAARWPDRDAVVVCHQEVRLSYAQLQERANDLAAAFIALGLERGDRIGIWAPNCVEWTITQFAAAKAGLILVNINPAYRLEELRFALLKVGCKALVSATKFRASNFIDILMTLAPESARTSDVSRAAQLPDLRWVINLGEECVPGMTRFDELGQAVRPEHHARRAELATLIQPDDAVNIQFTSGTTGSAKGATLTHFNIVNNALFAARAMKLGEQDRICIPVPLYHCFGMVLGNLGCVTRGATMVYPNDGFDPRLTLAAVEREQCTALFGVPTMFLAMLEHPEFATFRLTSLRTGMMAGAPCPVEVMKRVAQSMHMREVTIGYGMTETSPASFQSDVDDTLERRVTTVGRVHSHVQVKIVDAQGLTVPRGVQGELLVRGYSVMKGYWDDPERTADCIDADGWLHTGDLASIDRTGYAQITGRLKDLVIRGGENISPREVEEFLYRHPQVQAVEVFGVPDQKYGEELCAWIQLKPGQSTDAEELIAYCRGQIAHFKIPRHWRFVTEFPLTVTGKVQKFVMRARMQQELAGQAMGGGG